MEDFEQKLNEMKLKIKNIQNNIYNIKFKNSNINHNENKYYKRHKTANINNHIRSINSFDESNNRNPKNISKRIYENKNNMKNNYNNINDSNKENNNLVYTQYNKKKEENGIKNDITYNFESTLNKNEKNNIPISSYHSTYHKNNNNINLFKLEKKHYYGSNNLYNNNINKTYDNNENKNYIFDFENNKIQENSQYDNLQKYYQESNILKNTFINNNTGNSFRKKFIPRKRNKENENNLNNTNSILNNTDLANTYNKTILQNKPRAISNRYSYDIENDDEIINELIEITNNYNESMKINKNNLIESYKIILREIKIKNEFINKVYDLYNNKSGDALIKNNETLITLWNWIKINMNNGNYEKNKIINDDSLERTLLENDNIKNIYSRKNKCYTDDSFIKNDEYKNLCEGIMKDYNLKNIKELKTFIKHLLNKQNKNDNFLEGIKKILLTGNKFK